MQALDDIYNTRIVELAGAMTRGERIAAPDASATAHSKLCGSVITVDLAVKDGVLTDYGQLVKACLLGQAAASVVGREIVGSTAAELRSVGGVMRQMLREVGPPPSGRWSDLGYLEPVRNYRARHASTLLVFDAIDQALDDLDRQARDEAPAAPGR